MPGIGIDFGTSNCAVAIADEDGVRHAALEPDSATPEVMPSALYLARDRTQEVGYEAIDTYVRENAGRSIRLRREKVGEIEVTVAGTLTTIGQDDGGAITDQFAVYAETDQDMPGRLFRGVKRWLGNRSLDRVRVFDASYRIVALVTPILAALREGAASEWGGPLPRVRIGRPIRYEGRGGAANEVAVQRMTEACGHAGLGAATFHPEPVAAALSYLHGGGERSDRIVLAFDFGGGTLDLCLLRIRAGRFEVLKTHGIPLGGDEIDRRILRRFVLPELGEGVPIRVLGGEQLHTVPFPMSDYKDRLLNWMHAHELNRPDFLEPIAQGARRPGEVGEKLSRLLTLITGNHAYSLFREVERAKVDLSSSRRATVRLDEIDLELDVERGAFEAMLDPVLEDVDACIDGVLEGTGVEESAVDVVVRTGGSSRIPAVAARLDARFPGRVVEHGAFTSIAAGLAIAAAAD